MIIATGKKNSEKQEMKVITIVIFVILQVLHGEALVGYDCSGGYINRTTLSLLDVKSCQEGFNKPSTKEIMVALTQVAGSGTMKVSGCYVKASHVITRCGKTLDQVYGAGRYTEIMDMTRDQCSLILRRNTYQSPHNGMIITGPRGVKKFFQSIVTAGSSEADGTCTPGLPFFANGAMFDRPLRTTEYEISGKRINAIIDYEEKKVILPNGVRCDYFQESCDAGELGQIFWTVEKPQCASKGAPREIVYKGPGKLVTVEEPDGNNSSYVLVNHDGSMFQIMVDLRRDIEICGFISHPTEHPKLFFTDLTLGYTAFPDLAALGSVNVDLGLYLNSKILYVTRNIAGQVEKLFSEFRSNRCAADIKNAMSWLTIATVSPREFAYQYMGTPGYTAVTTGEVVHIAKCKSVDVVPVASDGRCYEELQVSWNGSLWYLTPRSRVLTRVGTEIQCTPGMHPAFKIMGGWYTPGSHGLVETAPPNVMTVDIQEYKFEPMLGLAEGGIYSNEALQKVQKMFLSPMEQEAVVSRVAASLTGETGLPSGYAATNMFTERDYEKIQDESSPFKKIWTPLSWATGPLFSIFVAFKVLKTFLNWIIDSRVLMSNFGILPALLCGCCTSIAHHMVSEEIHLPYIDRKKVHPEDREYDPNLYAPASV